MIKSSLFYYNLIYSDTQKANMPRMILLTI